VGELIHPSNLQKYIQQQPFTLLPSVHTLLAAMPICGTSGHCSDASAGNDTCPIVIQFGSAFLSLLCQDIVHQLFV
jgi:hypothetical protein